MCSLGEDEITVLMLNPLKVKKQLWMITRQALFDLYHPQTALLLLHGGTALQLIEAFLVEWAEHYQDLGNDQSGRSIPQFHMICHVTIMITMVYTENVIC